MQKVGDKNVELLEELFTGLTDRWCGYKSARKQQTRKPEQRGTRAKGKTYARLEAQQA